MKLLYFGTVCDLEEYENSLRSCKQKPTIATINFETSLLEGFQKNNVDVDIYSFPMIPIFPKSKLFCWGSKKQSLSSGYCCTWLKTINLPVIKQLSRNLDGKHIIKRWLRENSGENCAILTYSIPPFLAKSILKYSKKYGVKCYAIVPDLLKNMYMNSKSGALIRYLKERYLKNACELQGMFDGYVYLTQAMSEEVNPLKPYVIMEGIANPDIFNGIVNVEKSTVPAVMYAGRLHKKYGIINLLDAFESADVPNAELWIFGNGTAEDEIKQRAVKNPQIRFFGRCSLQKVLEFEKKATLLVNPRSPEEEFTQFSFPSKTIEYMLSGTPLLTTRLQGIPNEYFDYIFSVEDNDVDLMASAIKDILSKSFEQLAELGLNASDFIIREKNAEVQARKILDFITTMEDTNANNS